MTPDLMGSALDIPFWILSRVTPLLPEAEQQFIHRLVGAIVNVVFGGTDE